nr:uncharacterized protein LOC111985376 [Quercus suber]
MTEDVPRLIKVELIAKQSICMIDNVNVAENSITKAFRTFCSDLGIKNRYSTPAYPQSNGQVEATNKVILNRLKKRLDDAKGRWAKELPNVLWAYQATPRRSTGGTPFSLTYRAKAMILAKVNLCSARVAGFDPAQNNELMEEHLNWLEECR